MVVREGAPSLRRRLAAAHHIFADTALPDVDAQFEQSPWMRGAFQPGFSRHILRIRSRTSLEMTGRPGFPQRTFQAGVPLQAPVPSRSRTNERRHDARLRPFLA